MCGYRSNVLGKLIGRLIDNRGRIRIVILRNSIHDHRQRCDARPWIRQVEHPAGQGAHGLGPVESEIFENCVGQCSRCGAAVETLADKAKRTATDPMGTALVADCVAPPAHAVRLSGVVARPRH